MQSAGTRNVLIRVLLAAGALVLSAPAAAGSSARERWTFAFLGRPHGVVYRFHPLGFSSSPRLRFRLPANTHEGGTNWYVIHLHFSAVVQTPALIGRYSIVAASTNDVGCAYIRFRPLSAT